MAAVRVRGANLDLPAQLDEALGRPRRLRLAEFDEGIFISRLSAGDRVLDVARVLLGRPVTRAASRSGKASFSLPMPLPEGDYGVANHHPRYFIMPRDEDPSVGRERYWANARGYHEHLAPAEQMQEAQAFSEWFVSEWLLPTGGQSFLELGCGAGRNLAELARKLPAGRLHGLDANEEAIAAARTAVPSARLEQGSLYDLSRFEDGSVDVVFTAGVLMHVPHDRVHQIVDEMLRIAAMAVVNAELHGPSHDFDFHRYPRDYSALYEMLGIRARCQVLPRDHPFAETGGLERVIAAAQVSPGDSGHGRTPAGR